jgi:predicted transcriptional regulator
MLTHHLEEKGIGVGDIAKMLGVSRDTAYRHVALKGSPA